MAKKEKEFKIKFSKNVNGCWSGYAVIRKPDGKIYKITVAASPDAKAVSAKKFVKEILDETVAEYLAREPGSVRIQIEEAE